MRVKVEAEEKQKEMNPFVFQLLYIRQKEFLLTSES